MKPLNILQEKNEKGEKNMNEICNKCGELMFKKLINYNTSIYGHKITISNIEGFSCPKCGNNILSEDENTKAYLNERLLEEKLKLHHTLDVEPIIINKIKKMRLDRNLSQKQVGDALKVTEQRYGAIERNVNTPTVLISYQLADLFGVSADELYELIYVPIDFYNKLINLELIEKENGYGFNFINEADTTRLNLEKIRNEINLKNKEIHQYRMKKRRKEISNEEFEKIKKDIKKDIDYNLVPTKKDLEKKMKKFESRLVVKQNHSIEWETWERIKVVFKDEVEKLY